MAAFRKEPARKTGGEWCKGGPTRSGGAFIEAQRKPLRQRGCRPLQVRRRATPPWTPMRASASGAQHNPIRTAASRADHCSGQRRLTGKGCEAARQQCWREVPTIASCGVRRATGRRSPPPACGIQCSRRMERTLRNGPDAGGTRRPMIFVLPDLPWAALLASITRDSRADDVIEAHTQALNVEAMRRLQEAGRTDVMVCPSGTGAGARGPTGGRPRRAPCGWPAGGATQPAIAPHGSRMLSSAHGGGAAPCRPER